MHTFSRPIIAAAVLVGAAFAALPPAAAKPLSACQIRHSICSEHCLMRNDIPNGYACIQRTCEHQNPGCGPDSVPRGGAARGRNGLVAPATAGSATSDARPQKDRKRTSSGGKR